MSALDNVAVSRFFEGSVDFITLTHAEQVEVRRELARRDKGYRPTNKKPPRARQAAPVDTPACEGHDPRVFTTVTYIAAALEVCEPCTVKGWCLDQVRPHEGFDGVAGGVAWSNGRRVK